MTALGQWTRARIGGFPIPAQGAGSACLASASWSPVWRSSRFHEVWADMAPKTRPWSRRRDKTIGQAIGHEFIIYPPTMEIRPGLFGRSFDGEANVREHADRLFEFLVGEVDRRLRERVRIQTPTDGGSNAVKSGEPHPQTQSGLGGRRRRRKS